MSRIKGRDTKPELLVRQMLWKLGYRYRVKSKVVGKPDIVFTSVRVAIFVDGCQWHCCPKHWVRPKSNTQFWDRKFASNRARDETVNAVLKAAGWIVLRFWEHEIVTDCAGVVTKVINIVATACSSMS